MKKNIVIAVLIAIIVILLGLGVNAKRTYDLEQYAKVNNCTWYWTGTAYGDDRDYICK